MNVYRMFKDLLPGDPLRVARVVSHTGSGDSTVQFPEGGIAIVRGASVPVLSNAYIKDGAIQGPAPSITPTEFTV